MPNTKEGLTGVNLDRSLVRAVKIDAAHWDSTIGAILHGLIGDYLAKPRVEREAFVRSLEAS